MSTGSLLELFHDDPQEQGTSTGVYIFVQDPSVLPDDVTMWRCDSVRGWGEEGGGKGERQETYLLAFRMYPLPITADTHLVWTIQEICNRHRHVVLSSCACIIIVAWSMKRMLLTRSQNFSVLTFPEVTASYTFSRWKRRVLIIAIYMVGHLRNLASFSTFESLDVTAAVKNEARDFLFSFCCERESMCLHQSNQISDWCHQHMMHLSVPCVESFVSTTSVYPCSFQPCLSCRFQAWILFNW